MRIHLRRYVPVAPRIRHLALLAPQLLHACRSPSLRYLIPPKQQRLTLSSSGILKYVPRHPCLLPVTLCNAFVFCVWTRWLPWLVLLFIPIAASFDPSCLDACPLSRAAPHTQFHLHPISQLRVARICPLKINPPGLFSPGNCAWSGSTLRWLARYLEL